MNQKSARIIATYFGLGLSKIAPGTMGSLGTLPLAYALIYFGGFWALMAAAAPSAMASLLQNTTSILSPY